MSLAFGSRCIFLGNWQRSLLPRMLGAVRKQVNTRCCHPCEPAGAHLSCCSVTDTDEPVLELPRVGRWGDVACLQNYPWRAGRRRQHVAAALKVLQGGPVSLAEPSRSMCLPARVQQQPAQVYHHSWSVSRTFVSLRKAPAALKCKLHNFVNGLKACTACQACYVIIDLLSTMAAGIVSGPCRTNPWQERLDPGMQHA